MRGVIKKPKTFVIEDFIYHFKWSIFLGGTINEAVSYFAKQIGVEPWSRETEPGAHFFAYRNKRAGGIWFKFQPRNYPGLVAHECFHAVQYWMEVNQAKTEENTEELFAYYLQWLVEEILLKS